MVSIILESHAATPDSEAGLASGWYDVDLSLSGIREARALGEKYKNVKFDEIICSDLKRSYKTGEIAFSGQGYIIIKDIRLRSCNYGLLTRHPYEQIDPIRIKYLETPYPNGESYLQALERFRNFLQFLLKDHQNKRIMIIGDKSQLMGLEHYVNDVYLEDFLLNHWKYTFGKEYHLEYI